MLLTQKRVEREKAPGRYACGLVRGLYLQVSHSGAKSWILRYQLNGVGHEMGLGSAAEFTLKEARERARLHRQLLADGRDPLQERRAAKAAAKVAAAKRLTFADCAQRYFDQNESKWRNASHRDQFLGTLRMYAFPVLGDMDVASIDTPDILRAVEPHWNSTAITVDRTRGRIEQVIDWAIVRGHRPAGPNPARWKGHLDQVLPAPRKIAPIVHHNAMPFQDVPAFMAELRQQSTVAARALEFLIHTAARTGEVTGATWAEIDLDNKTWTIPANRMKAGREHRVPLSDHCIALLKALPREAGNAFVFIGSRAGAGLSRMALPWVMDRLDQKVTIHGFRSSFRDWAGEVTSFAHDICEAALAHVRGDHSVRAYARGDLFDKRRKLMDAWAKFCAAPAKVGGKVVGIRRKAAS